MGQVVETCPGLLVLTDGFVEEGREGRTSALAVLRDVIAGHPLRAVLDEAVGYWLRLSPYLGGERYHDWESAQLHRRLIAKRLHIRRARSHVRAADLMDLPPYPFTVEDVPDDTHLNGLWYEFVRCSQAVLDQVPDPRVRQQVTSFISRHGLNLFKSAYRRGGSPRVLLGRVINTTYLIIKYAQSTGHVPVRKADARRYIEGARRSDCGTAVPVCTSSELPDFPAAVECRPDEKLGLELIRTSEQLMREGSEMEHCVATFLPRILAGAVTVFGNRGPLFQRLTVAVAKGVDRNWLIEQARGYRNRPPTKRESELLGAWIAALNEQSMPPSQQSA